MLAVLVALTGSASAQDPAPAKPAAAEKEMAVRDESVTFRSRVNLILVPVIVRDRSGKATGDLHQEDFSLFDNGKPQTITKFSVEKAGQRNTTPQTKPAELAQGEQPTTAPIVPERFTAFLIDDIHVEFADLARVRDAIVRHLDSIRPTERIGVFTTSGAGNQDFTDDKDVLRLAMMRIQPHPIARPVIHNCPDVSYYAADMVQNRHESVTMTALIQNAVSCMNLSGPGAAEMAKAAVESTSRQVLVAGDHETRVTMTVFKDVIRRLSAAPGQRNLVLASPGLLVLADQRLDKGEIVDRAIRANVVINCLDARGLYVDPSIDASRPSTAGGPDVARMMDQLLRDSALAEGDILAELSYGTGGALVHNGNDFDAALKRLAGPPDYVYMLAFSPQNLKIDGRFHSIKVSLKNGKGLNLQARRGYYAPKTETNPEETARQEIEEALFSREEMRDIPVEFHTQFFKRNEFNAKLSVLSRVDVRQLRFRKAEGRNYDDLTVVTALFDRNGNMINAIKQFVQMRLLDETVANRLAAGLTLRTAFDIPPGAYAIRVVVRDAEGQLMSAANGSVEIP